MSYNPNDPRHGKSGMYEAPLIDFLSVTSERGELEKLRAEKRMRESAADADALRALALYSIPQSLRDFGEIHRIPTFVEIAWINAFMAGWRARDPEVSK